jgi:hypothetical protein
MGVKQNRKRWPTEVREADFVADVQNWIEAHENDPKYRLEEWRETRKSEACYWRALASEYRWSLLGFLCEMRYWRAVIRGRFLNDW